MIVYHGSTEVIQYPDVVHSKKYLDFGEGFYVTKYEDQARKWARRRGMRNNSQGVINIYEISDNWEGLNTLSFQNENEKWLDFVCACRKGKQINQGYDLIEGNVADDDVFKTIDMYVRGIWDKQKVLEELRYHKENHQICFVTQLAIDKLLTFKEYVEVQK